MNSEQLDLFLERFCHVQDLSDIRRLNNYEYPEFNSEFLSDLAVYVIANYECIALIDRSHRFFDICIQFFYRDKRSLNVLEMVVKESFLDVNSFEVDSVNCLAAFCWGWEQLNLNEKIRIQSLCREACLFPELAYNALAFLRLAGGEN